MIRRSLETLYRGSGFAGSVMLLAMLFMVIAQMIARWIEVPVTGLTEIAGYCMAATSFFGLGYAFSRQAHIRVNLIIGQSNGDGSFAEVFCTSIAVVIAGALAWFAVKTTVLSYLFEEVSQGQDAIHTWAPQVVMSFGSLVLLIAVVDRLCVQVAQLVRSAGTGRGRLTGGR